MNTWFPNGVVPTNRQIVTAYLMLPYHVRMSILRKMDVYVEDENYVTSINSIHSQNKILEFMEMIRDATKELGR